MNPTPSNWSEDQIAEARKFFRQNDITCHGKHADDMTVDELAKAVADFSQKIKKLDDVLRRLEDDQT